MRLLNFLRAARAKVRLIEAASYAPDEIVNFSSFERRRLIELWAQSLPIGTKILDAGAGECQYRSLFKHCEYKTQDFCAYVGSREGISAETWSYGNIDYVSDITDIPVDSACFDALISTEVLEHLPEPIRALKEFGRVIKPGGRILITAPLNSGLHQEPFHFYGGFTPHFYKRFLTDFGFTDINVAPIRGLLANVSQEMIRVVRYSNAHNSFISLPARLALSAWLPRLLFKCDSKYMVPEFTIGYVVEARKV